MKKGLLFAVVVTLVFGTAAYAKGTVKIGLMAPLTGAWASEGEDMKNIVKLLADDLNAAGGLLGKQVEVIVEDDGGDPRTAALAAQRLSTRGIVAVIGTYGSSVTEASQNIYDESTIIQVANGSTAIRLSEKGMNYFFRTCPRDDEQSRVAVKTLLQQGYKKVAILHDNTTYAKGLASEIKSNLKGTDADIVFYDALTPGERDYTAVLTTLKAAGPDAVFFTGYYPEAAMLLRQKMEMNWDVPFLGGDATNHPDLVKIAGKDATRGFFFLSPPLPQDLMSAEAKAFMVKFTERFHRNPASIYGVLAGDGFNVVVAAIKGAGSTNPKAVAAYLHDKLENMPGLTGSISFNAKGDRVGDVYRVYKVAADGSFVLQP
ncbi:MAG: branched chain amino acid ABC transporter substrate-binding protein [Deltaproteobacteria bacterium]|nr:MAG: branched chain amino acid ABC transporter substrate-binding protein [Deltaproteobacteria bacterium]